LGVTVYVRPGRKYQLQSSFDLTAWTNCGEAFVAAAAQLTQEFNAVETGRFFRLAELP
jgi:hypothetical protein